MLEPARHAPRSKEIDDDRLALRQLASAEGWALIIECGQRDIGCLFTHERRRQFLWRPLKQADIKQDRQAQKNHNRNNEKQPLHVWPSPSSPLSSSKRRTLRRALLCACNETTIAAHSTIIVMTYAGHT